jgi:formamidopyrimidine-DNA glycosylase
MPELPEVETVRRGLEPVMQNHVIRRVRTARPDLRFPLPRNFSSRLKGARVLGLDRRAKYILVRLDTAETLLMHLGMTGRFTIVAPGLEPYSVSELYYATPSSGAGHGPHDHVVFELDDGPSIVYTDARRFGFMDLIPGTELAEHPLLRNLGVEPLSAGLDAAYLAEAFATKRAPLKAALGDQRLIAGLGNIYVCEALYRARLSPLRVASTIAKKPTDPRLGRLVEEIRAVLNEALEAGGSTLRDYVKADGSSGSFQQRFAVYDREGERCPREACGGTVRRIVQAGRSTFYCPKCQR